LGFGESAGVAARDIASAIEQQVLGPAPVGLEPARLSGLELVARQVESTQVLERSPNAREALGERAGESSERVATARLRTQHVEWIVEQALVLRLAVGRLPRADQRSGLVDLESVTLDSGRDLLLHVVRERAERARERGAQGSVGDPRLKEWRELAG
jgi:hypothetical protein